MAGQDQYQWRSHVHGFQQLDIPSLNNELIPYSGIIKNAIIGENTTFKIRMEYPDEIKTISQVKEVDIHSLIGNIGGYLGLFLGNGNIFLLNNVLHSVIQITNNHTIPFEIIISFRIFTYSTTTSIVCCFEPCKKICN